MKTILNLVGCIEEEMVANFLKETDEILDEYCEYLDQLDMVKKEFVKPFPTITIEISSGGGDIHYGSAILDRIEEMQMMGIRVDTTARGLCYSMAFIIFLMGRERYAGRWTTFMNHASSSRQYGYLEDIRNNVEFLEQMDKMFDELILEKTKMTQERLNSARLKCDWIGYEEAIELGIINIFDEKENNVDDVEDETERVVKEFMSSLDYMDANE